MQYYLVMCDQYPNGIVLRQDQVKQLKLQSYDILIPIDTAMVSATRQAL